MRLRGVRVASVARIEEVRSLLLAERDRWAAEVKRLLGPKAELNSSDTLGPALAERGVPVPRTPIGKWSVTKELLEKHKGDEAINAIAAGRRVGTLVSLTIDSLLTHRTSDGRVHPEWNTLKGEDENGNLRGTIARFSSSNPNAQQIPSRQSEFDELLFPGPKLDLPELIRGLFLPEEGELWEADDESQIEYRLLVNFAVGGGADEARHRYNTDPATDYHKFAAELLRVDPEDQKRRKRVKNVNFAYGYGAREDQLARTFNCSVEEARRFLRTYDEELPFVRSTYDRAAEWAQRRGYVETVLKRKCRFPLWEPRGNHRKRSDYVPALPYDRAVVEYRGRPLVRANTYKALNRKLQGSGADVLKKAMVDGHEAGLTGPLGAYLLTVHDELGLSVPRTAAGEEAAAELRRIMETCVPLRVPLLVKSERGETWGSVR
jgi:DNA polymerase-1